jgi:hypothetical protein
MTTTKPGKACWGQGILALLFLAGAVAAPWIRSQAAGDAKETFATLCGRLVFLTKYRTEQKLIGIIPCSNSTQPIIFDARPGTLHNYYRLYDAVVDSGPTVVTLEYGPVRQYVKKFSGYDPIEDCRRCKITAPTRTPNPPQAAQECAAHLLESGVELFPEFEAVEANRETLEALEKFANSAEVKAQCNGDATCEAEAVALEIGRQLGERVKHTSERRDRLIEFLLGVVKDPSAAVPCKRFPALARFIAAGLSQKGFAIDALASVSPATHLITDARGRKTGLLETGAIVEEIPGAGVAVSGLNKLVLLPGGQVYELALRGTAPGPAALEAAVNRGDEVWLMTFRNTPVSAKTIGRLDLSGELPWLQYSDGDKENASPAAPFVRLPVLDAWLPTATPAPPPTATPTMVTPTKTRTPAITPSLQPSPTNERGRMPTITQTALAMVNQSTPTIRPAAATQPETGGGANEPVGGICPPAVGTAALPVAVLVASRITRRRRPSSHAPKAPCR